MTEESIEQLMERGYELIEEEEFEEAIQVGNQLVAKRHTSAFEILALAYAGLDDIEKSVEVLEEGVANGPTVWLLWQLLGNYRSDLGQYSQALQAYERALSCPQVEESSVHLNIAITLAREERYDGALAELQLVTNNEISGRATAERLGILNRQDKSEKAIHEGESFLRDIQKEPDAEALAMIKGELGRAYWQSRSDRERALELAQECLELVHAQRDALWLIREIDRRTSPQAKYFRLLVEGDWPELDEDGNPLGFFVTYDVVAEHLPQALEYVRNFESVKVRSSLEISESEELEERPEDPMGVYMYTGYNLYPKNVDD